MRDGYIYKVVPQEPRCGRCRYPLANLEENVCPECGEPFDLAERSALGVPVAVPLMWAAWAGAMLAPLVEVALAGGCWLAARAQLGRAPVMWRDDPRDVVAGWLYGLWSVALMSWLLAPFLALFASLYLIYWHVRNDRKRPLFLLLLLPLPWVVAIMFHRTFPGLSGWLVD